MSFATVLARLVDRCHDGLIRQEDVLADLQELQARPRPQPAVATLRDASQTFEREYISTVLEEYGWRMTKRHAPSESNARTSIARPANSASPGRNRHALHDLSRMRGRFLSCVIRGVRLGGACARADSGA